MESHVKYEGGEGQEESWKSTLRKEAKTNYSVSSGWMREMRIQPDKEVESGYMRAQEHVAFEWSSLEQPSRGEDT